MRLNLLITCAALAALSIIITFVLTLFVPAPQVLPPQVSQSTTEPLQNIPLSPSDTEYEYLLKDYNGKLAVYFKDEPNPQKVFDVYLATLPSYDRGQLKLGVTVKDYEELLQRIEDYIS